MNSNGNEMNDLEKALSIALQGHTGQTDKAGDTYIRHPLRVMQQMETETERIVAVLHDTVEDTEYTLDDIEDQFGMEVREAVDVLTKRDGESYLEFVDRAAENSIARRVKLADLEDNMNVTRLDNASDSVWEKQKLYHEAWNRLRNAKNTDSH